MKVCVVNPNYYRSSGVTTAIRRIYAGAAAQGIDQYFVDCGYGEEGNDIDWIPPDKLQRFQLMAGSPLRLLSQVTHFLHWLRNNQIRVVHVHHRRLAAILNPLQGIGRFRLIYTAQLSYPYEFWFWLTAPGLGVAISPSVAANLKKTMRIKQIEIIGNASDFPEQFPAEARDKASRIAICVARLEPVKAHKNLIEAWKLLSDQGIPLKLSLLGEGSLKESLQAQVKQLQLEHLVEFRGFQKDVQKELDGAWFAVLASEVEGHPVAVIEAAARGLPTLVTDVDGSRDCVPPSRPLPNRIPFGDAPKFAEAISTWVNQPDRVEEEGRVFFEFHKEHHSTEVVGRKYAELYRRCAN